MRVLHVIESLGAGGTERSLAELLPPLAAAGVDSAVVCFHRRRGAHEEVEGQGIPVTVLPPGGWGGRVAALRRRLAAARPDLVHTTLFRADLAGRLAAAGSGVPVLGSLVSTPYAPVRFRDPGVKRARLRLVRLADAWTARSLCAHFHAVSETVKRAAVGALGVAPERVTVVPRGRDPERLGRPSAERRRRARAALGLDDGAELALAVGRHEFAKGLPDLVEAAAALAPRRPRLTVLVAGRPGALTGELERRIAAAGLDGRVRLLGHRDDLPELLAAADLFVFPSLYEGMPGALIEAMALGLPAVASDLPAVREVVEPGASALLAPPGDPAALGAAIEALLDDRARAAALGRRGREIFERRFTLDRSVAGMLDLYHRLLDGAPARPRSEREPPPATPRAERSIGPIRRSIRAARPALDAINAPRPLDPEPPPLLDRLRLRRDLWRALRRLDRRALVALRRSFRDSCPAAYESKYWRLRHQAAKNLRRAHRLGLHRPPAGLAVLDLGTGFGLFPFVCRLYGHRAIGLDLEDAEGSLYRAATAVLGVERLLGPIRRHRPLPVPDRRFDLVTGFAALFHDPPGEETWGAEEWRFFLGDLAGRLLAPGGRVFLSLNDDRHGRPFDAETAVLFRTAGAEIAGRDVYFPALDRGALSGASTPSRRSVRGS